MPFLILGILNINFWVIPFNAFISEIPPHKKNEIYLFRKVQVRAIQFKRNRDLLTKN